MINERQEWIIKWLSANASADVCNQQFHEDYHAAFPKYARKETAFGAQPVAQAQRDLAAMAKRGILEVVKVRMGERLPGFSSWVLSYRLTDLYRNHYR